MEKPIETEPTAELVNLATRLERFKIAEQHFYELDAKRTDALKELQSATEDVNNNGEFFDVELSYPNGITDTYIVGAECGVVEVPIEFRANKIYLKGNEKYMLTNTDNGETLHTRKDEFDFCLLQESVHIDSKVQKLGGLSVEACKLVDKNNPNIGNKWPWDRMTSGY